MTHCLCSIVPVFHLKTSKLASLRSDSPAVSKAIFKEHDGFGERVFMYIVYIYILLSIFVFRNKSSSLQTISIIVWGDERRSYYNIVYYRNYNKSI